MKQNSQTIYTYGFFRVFSHVYLCIYVFIYTDTHILPWKIRHGFFKGEVDAEKMDLSLEHTERLEITAWVMRVTLGII